MNTENDVRLLEGAYALCKANYEQLKADTAHHKRVFDALLNRGFAESEEATAEQWANELIAAIERIDSERMRRQQSRLAHEQKVAALQKDITQLRADRDFASREVDRKVQELLAASVPDPGLRLVAEYYAAGGPFDGGSYARIKLAAAGPA